MLSDFRLVEDLDAVIAAVADTPAWVVAIMNRVKLAGRPAAFPKALMNFPSFGIARCGCSVVGVTVGGEDVAVRNTATSLGELK
jgi:hypothetical protein